MAQGARRPPRHRPPRQASDQEPAGHAQHTSKGETQAGHAELDRIIAVLSCLSPEQLRATSAVNDEDPVKRLRLHLPIITQSVDVDAELYALLATIVNLCIQSWYEKITPNREINSKLVNIIVACLQIVQQRLANVDLLTLVLDDVPAIITEHLETIEFANRAQVTQECQSHTRKVFHTLRPHPALHPVPTTPDNLILQHQSQSEWCQIVVDKVLPLLLPPSDLQNPSLSVIVREIFSEMILMNGVCEKLCESWFIWETITRVLSITTRTQVSSAPQGNCSQAPNNQWSDYLRNLLSLVWHLVLDAWSILLIMLSTNGRSTLFVSWTTYTDLIGTKHDGQHPPIFGSTPGSGARGINHRFSRRPLLTLNIWSCVAMLTRIDHRMPWLAGSLSLLHWLLLHGPGKVGGEGSTLDRWFTRRIYQILLQPSMLSDVLRIARHTLFPGGAFAHARSQPLPDEITAIRQACGKAVLDSIPVYTRRIYFATTDEEAIMEDVLKGVDLFADPYINKALVISIVELLLSQLFPELVDLGSM